MVLSWLPKRCIKWLKLDHLFITPVNQVLDYTQKYRRRFDDSYKQDQVNSTNINFSSNIEPEIYDKTRLNEILFYDDNVLEKAWKRRILIENTPRGNIYMYYDIFKCGFAYYADQTGIPYTILNAVAMKYVMIFFCRDFYMDEATIPINKGSPLIYIFFEDNKNVDIPEYEKEQMINKFIFMGHVHNWQPIQLTPKQLRSSFFSSKYDSVFGVGKMDDHKFEYM
jgi:hypothetical protein